MSESEVMIPTVVLVLPNIGWSGDGRSVNWTIWPISLCTIAAVLEPKYNVKVIDANVDNMSISDVMSFIKNLKPFAIGISVFCDDFAAGGHAIAASIKAFDNLVSVVMGGSYVTLNSDIAIKDGNVDYLVVGEGELIFKEILDFLSGHAESLPDCGIVYRTKDKKIIDTGRAPAISNLDQLPFPDYSKIDFTKYSEKEERNSAYMPPVFPYGRITTSRGCPHQCCFCQVAAINGAGIRYRSVSNVLEEVAMLLRDYNIKSLLIDDANFTVDRRRAKDIIRGFIERKFSLKWRIMNLAAYTLDDELLELMIESGCNHIDLAIESGSKRVLKEIIHKPLHLDKVKAVIDKAKALGFMISANFIIGFPGETWSEIRETVSFAEVIDVDYVKIMAAMPLRHTDLFETAKNKGYLKNDFDFMNMRWGLGEISTEEFSSFDITILRAYEWDRINFSSAKKINRVARLMSIDEEKIGNMRIDTRRAIKNLFAPE